MLERTGAIRTEAFERYSRGEAVIIPIIADACPWWDSQFLKGFEVLPDDARPIDDWPTKARAMTSIYEGVKRLVLVKNSQANDLFRSPKDDKNQSRNYKINLEEDRKKDRLEPINKAHEERQKRDAFRLFRRGEDSTDWEEKIDLYSKAIKLNERYDEAFCKRGLAKIQLKEYESAVQDFDETVKINPNYFEAYFNRGWIKLISKQVQEAITDFDHAIRIYPRSANYFYQRGCAKLELNHFIESKNDFNQAIDLNLNTANVYINRGVANERLELWDEAELDYQKALEIDPNSEYAKDYLKNLRTIMKHNL